VDSETGILIKNGMIYEHDGDTDLPRRGDILIEGDRIAAVGDVSTRPNTAGLSMQTIDATGKLVLPGFVNGHYHSHDTLLKGSFETIPLEFWILNALPPAYPKRSKEEVRARTLIGALECIRYGITTVQDMLTLYPFDPEHVDVVLEAYDLIGLRVVFAPQFSDIRGVDRVPNWKEEIPPAYLARLGYGVEPFSGVHPVDVVEGQYLSHRGRHPRITWGLAPTSPEFCTPDLLKRVAEVSMRHRLPVFTHINESKSMAVAGRVYMPEFNGSQVEYLRRVDLLGPRLALAHSVWMTPSEIELLAQTGTNVVVNPVGNLKTKSGIAPIREFLEAGINVGLGCDNCSCGDTQNMFAALHLFASLPAVTNPEPGRPFAADAIHAATLGSALAVGLEGEVGALRPGMKADLSLLDLTEPSFVPLNSAARQVVFTESGASVSTVVIDGKIVMANRRINTIDEAEIREAVAAVMPSLKADLHTIEQRLEAVQPYLLKAWMRSWETNIGVNRYVQGDG
jgi:5-methylthioadenosine/S-adenosylhomocysteine deaminase